MSTQIDARVLAPATSARHLPPLLDGVRVVEQAQNGAAPFAGRILADLGADVIKVEPPQGDPARQRDAAGAEFSGLFEHANAGKRSVVLDHTTSNGRRVFSELLGRADCVIADETSALLGTQEMMESIPVGAPVVMVTPFGLDDRQVQPVRGARALFHAGGEGFMTPRGAPLTAPPVAPSANIAWFDAGVAGAYAALLGLFHRSAGTEENDGGGPRIFDIAIRDVQVGLCRQDICAFVNEGHLEDRAASHSASMGIQLRCSDGEATLHLADQHWPGWCRLIGREELIADSRFSTREARVEHLEVVIEELERWTRTRTRADVQDQTQSDGLPVAAIVAPHEVLLDNQLAHRGYFASWTQPVPIVLGSALPFVTYEGARWYPARPAPALGGHTGDICAELGFSTEGLVGDKGMEEMS